MNVKLITHMKEFKYNTNNRENLDVIDGNTISKFGSILIEKIRQKYLSTNFTNNVNSERSNNFDNQNISNKSLKTNHLSTQVIGNKIIENETDYLNNLKNLFFQNNLNPNIRNKNFIVDIIKDEQIDVITSINDLLQNQTSRAYYHQETTSFHKPPKFLVILIQIHSRLNYLSALIESLRETKYIEQTLVIFSHDLYDEKMNKLIEKIDFCATLQIFYPFSLQLYPNSFPGKDPNDCPKSIKKAGALLSKCNNAAHPDSYGNYRESNIVQIKHHWLWKLAYTFEQLNETKNLQNLNVLLLEEDHYLMPDSIHVLRKLSEKILSDIDVVSLAVFEKQKQNIEMKNLNTYSKSIWHSSNHNTGLFIGRPQWKMIKDCSNAFCTYDDYNWDWTLQHIGQTCFKLPLVSIYPVSSRVIHIGECGTHHKGKNCDPKEIVNKLKNLYNSKQENYFPETLNLNGINTGIRVMKKSNGGWSDPRDHQLCKSFINPISKLNVTMSIKA